MNKFNINDELILKKYVLGIAGILLLLYLIGSFFEEGIIKATSNYILYGTQEDQDRADRAAREYQKAFERIENGMKSIADEIKQGAKEIEKDTKSLKERLKEDQKLIEKAIGHPIEPLDKD